MNAMKPGIQCVLTHWKSVSYAFARGEPDGEAGHAPLTGVGGPNTSSRRLARLGRLARTVAIRPVSTSATVTPGEGPRSARTTPSGSTSMLRPTPVAALVGGSSG